MILNSPYPKENYVLANKTDIKTIKKVYLPHFEIISKSYIELLKMRESERIINKKLDISELSPLLWFTFKVRDEIKNNKNIITWQKKYIPTAGGLGSISVLLLNIKSLSNEIYLYSGMDHSLNMLPTNKKLYQFIMNKYLNFFDTALDATICLYIMDIAQLQSKYDSYESLAWRDVGIVYQNMSLLCQLYNVKSCLIGNTDDNNLIKSEINENFELIGVQVLGH